MNNQINGNNSVQTKGLKAERDINIRNGVSYTEVERIVLNLFDANFPKLLKESYERATENINNVLALLKAKIEIAELKLDKLKLSTPDVHYVLNEAITIVGRKGENVDGDLLSELLVEKMMENKGEYELLLDEALSITPKLNKEYLDYLATIVMLYTFGINVTQNEEEYDLIFSGTFLEFPMTLTLSDSMLSYLVTLGLIRLRPYRIKVIDSEKNLIRNDLFYNSIKKMNSIDIKNSKLKMPKVYEVYKKINETKIELYEPTALGNLIGATYFKNNRKKFIPNFSMDIRDII